MDRGMNDVREYAAVVFFSQTNGFVVYGVLVTRCSPFQSSFSMVGETMLAFKCVDTPHLLVRQFKIERIIARLSKNRGLPVLDKLRKEGKAIPKKVLKKNPFRKYHVD